MQEAPQNEEDIDDEPKDDDQYDAYGDDFEPDDNDMDLIEVEDA